MKSNSFNRRDFIRTSAVLTGAALLSPLAIPRSFAAAEKRTAADQVTLGKTGIKLSRLGIGTGSNNGFLQTAEGKEHFRDLIHYAYDHGITYIDTAERYDTFGWIGDAIKGLPREKLFIQSKVPDRPSDVLSVIDKHRKTFNTDYIDSLLIHCMTRGNWTDADQWKRVMDGFDQAKEKKWIRAKGVSCHSLPALKAATASDWTEVHLVRINPQGKYVDTNDGGWDDSGASEVNPVLDQIKTMHAKGHGVIGMKIFGNGDFTDPADREKSIRYAMSRKEIDAIVIGFTQPKEIDEAIDRINRALAGA
ncbi:MAG TPA: aldo/keto reductase [Candidatus Paceibacterota bacterium]|nr:aldo/keto reductase [Candidatus Paceibacterota bacterium]